MAPATALKLSNGDASRLEKCPQRRVPSIHLALKEQCKPLRYADVPNVLKTAGSTFRDDSYSRYRFGTSVPGIIDPVKLCSAIRRRQAWTIDGGDAFVLFHPAPNSVSCLRRTVDSLLGHLLGVLLFFMLPFQAREITSRAQELKAKHHHAVETSLGRRIRDMLMIETLFVAPEKRGRGYGSRLLEFVTSKADTQSRGTWVTTTPHGTGFYRLFGFRTVSRYHLGECDAAWKEPPVVRCIMLREPRSVWEIDEKARLV